MDEPFFSFQRWFDGLDEITPYHDYPNVLCGICYEWLCGGISFYGFTSKFFHINSQLKCYWFSTEPLSNNFTMESSYGDSTLKLLQIDSKLESSTYLPKSYPSNSIDIIFFNWLLSKFDRPKIKPNLVGTWYFNLSLPKSSFQLTLLFYVDNFLVGPSWKCPCKPLCFPPPSMVAFSSLGTLSKYM